MTFESVRTSITYWLHDTSAKRGRLTFKSSKERETIKFQGFGSVNEIREIERGDIISDHDVRIYPLDEISPSE